MMSDVEKELLNDDVTRLEAEAVEAVEINEPTPQETAQAQNNKNELQGAIALLLNTGFSVLTPNWKVQPEETEMLAQAYTELIDKYFPDGLTRFGVEVNALLITLVFLAPRLKMPRKLPKEQDAEKND